MNHRTAILASMLAIGAAAVFISLASLPSARAQGGEPIDLLAADVVPTGNTATSLGPLDGCTRVEPGAEFQVDVIVDAIPASRGLIGFQYHVAYDAALADVVALDSNYLLGAVGVYEPYVAFQDPLPDSDGDVEISLLDLATNAPVPGANVESGPGVITRITFRAKGAGAMVVSPTAIDLNTYPGIIDAQNVAIPINRLLGGVVAIGVECPAGVTPVPQPISPLPTEAPPETPPPSGAPGQTTPPEGGAPGGSATAAPGGSPAASPGASSSPSASRTPAAAEPTVPGAGDSGGDGGGSSAAAWAAAALLAIGGVGAAGYGFYRLQSARKEPAAGAE